jgi:hypothetical protein
LSSKKNKKTQEEGERKTAKRLTRNNYFWHNKAVNRHFDLLHHRRITAPPAKARQRPKAKSFSLSFIYEAHRQGFG